MSPNPILIPRTLITSLLLSVFAVLLFAHTSPAAEITAGNAVVYRVGTGAASLGSLATAVYLDEYTSAGILVQSIALPTTGSNAVTAVGNSTTEGLVSRSQDGTKLVFGGYRKDAGAVGVPSSDSYATTPRLVNTLSRDGTVASYGISSVNGSTSASALRSTTTVDGSAFWIQTSSQLAYVGSAFSSSNAAVTIESRIWRQINVSDNKLYVSTTSLTTSWKVATYGTLATNAASLTSGIDFDLSAGVIGYVFLDLDSSVPGDDTLYAMNTVGSTLVKMTYDGTTWTNRGSIPSSGGQTITAYVSNNVPVLYVTSASTLYSLTDTSGAHGTLTGALTTLATAASNTAFRGVGTFAPLAPLLTASQPDSSHTVVAWKTDITGLTLETSTNLTSGWTNAASQANPQTNTIDPSTPTLFYRMKK